MADDIFVDVYQGGASRAHYHAGPLGQPAVRGAQRGHCRYRRKRPGRQPDPHVQWHHRWRRPPGSRPSTGSVTPTQPGRNVLKPDHRHRHGGRVRLSRFCGAARRDGGGFARRRPRRRVTYLPGGTSVILALTAPNKQFVYAIGEFNNFQTTNAGFMNQTADGKIWWVQLNGLTPGQEYAYQYLIDGNLRVADPYTEKVLDPSNDQRDSGHYLPRPALPYAGQTGIMSTLQTNQPAFQWQTTNFTRPAKANLVIYELHVRDFIARSRLPNSEATPWRYIQRLGINCVELMPVNEFEGNDGWGYNPSFYFAPDKYYGTKDNLKRLHRRGPPPRHGRGIRHGAQPLLRPEPDGANVFRRRWPHPR